MIRLIRIQQEKIANFVAFCIFLFSLGHKISPKSLHLPLRQKLHNLHSFKAHRNDSLKELQRNLEIVFGFQTPVIGIICDTTVLGEL